MTLLRQVERYLDHHDMTATAFGRAAANDPNLVFDLRRGRELRSATTKRVRQFMAKPVKLRRKVAAQHVGAAE